MSKFLAAVVQLTSTSDGERNLKLAEYWIRQAAAAGANLVVTPENTNYLGPHTEKVRLAERLDGPTVAFFAKLSAELNLHLLLGSFNEKSPTPGRCFNTSVLLDPRGEVVGTYRKIHLFDVDVSPQVSFVESSTVQPGTSLTVVDTSLGKLGLSICYDLRFGELYRALVDREAELITIPSAFTKPTGEAHWEILVRARAIESQAWVLAAGQVGHHDDGGLRESFGQSMIVDPWGRVVAQVEDGPGMAVGEVDLALVRQVRQSIPVQAHRAARSSGAGQDF